MEQVHRSNGFVGSKEASVEQCLADRSKATWAVDSQKFSIEWIKKIDHSGK